MQAHKLVTVLAAAAAGCLTLVGVVGAAPTGTRTTVGSPANVSKQLDYNGEGTIAINPTDPTKLFAGYNNTSTSGQWARSTDSGATWSVAGTGIGSSCCDNVAEWDSFGNLFLTNLDSGVDNVPLYLSTDNGANFSLLTTIDTCINCIDQPTMKAGPSSIWVTWNDAGTIKARGASVTGLGSGNIGSFTTEQSAPSSTGCQFGDIAVSPTGDVVAVCQTDTQIKAYTDADGLGAGGFGAAVVATATNVGRFDAITPQPNRTIDSEGNLAYDLSSGPNAGRLYLVYTNESVDENNDTDIFVRYSDNDGATWSSEVKVNDDGTSTAQFFPVITVDSTTGNVFVSFLDCRNDVASNTHTEYWGAISTDGGASFDANFQLSDDQSLAANDPNPNEYGDYTGNDYYGDKGYGIWPDNSNSTGDNPDGADFRFDMYTAQVDTSAANTAPTAVAGSASTEVDTPVTVTLHGTDAESCDLTFAIASGPSHGSLGAITNVACVAGSPNTDTATVLYTPAAGYIGSDSFTFEVTDGDALTSAAATISLTISPAGPTEINVGDNVNTTKLKGDDAEATIAIDPTKPAQVFAAVNPYTAKKSTNGGLKWSKAGSGVGSTCCDNAAAWDDFGNLFLVNINSFFDEIPLYVSTNGGKKFTKLLSLNSSPFVDQPTVKTGAGAVWATWNEDGTIVARGAAVSGLGLVGPFNAIAAVPGTHAPFGQPTRRLPGVKQPAPGSDTLSGQFGDIAIGPDGQVVVAWQTDSGLDTCPCSIYVNTDADGLGAGGFGTEVLATSTNVAKFDFITPQPNRSVDAEANLAYDRSGGTHDGRLYLVYTDETPDESSDTDIYIRHSDDDGATWSSAVKINDDATTQAQFLPYLAVDQTTGHLIVTWYDARNDAGNHDAQYWGAVSADGGDTFGANFQISEGTTDADAGFDPGFEYGDYSWVDFVGGVALPVWSDNSNSTGDNPDGAGSGLDLYTARIEVNLCDGKQATILGTAGDDGSLDGTPGDDVILGFGGNDTINGMGGNDTICAGDGDDTINQGSSSDGADDMFGGPGTDTIDYSARSGNVTVTFDGKKKSGEKKEKDAIEAGVENATAGSGGSKMTGSSGANVLTGGAGKDTLDGKNGADTLNGSDGIGGNDTVDCGKKDGVADTFSFDLGPPADKLKNCP